MTYGIHLIKHYYDINIITRRGLEKQGHTKVMLKIIWMLVPITSAFLQPECVTVNILPLNVPTKHILYARLKTEIAATAESEIFTFLHSVLQVTPNQKV